LVQLCGAFKTAETELSHRVLRVKAVWVRISYHLGLLSNIAQILPAEYQELQDQTLKVLLDKLEETVSKLESVVEKGKSSALSQSQTNQLVRVKKSKYALLEGRLNKAIDDLETWQGIFDPSWYLIIKAAIPQMDEELARYDATPIRTAISPSYALRDALRGPSQDATSIWLNDEGMAHLRVADIPFTSAKLAQRPQGGRELILESISCKTQINPTTLTRDVRDLARKLSHADPVTFGLLKCKGVVKHLDRATQLSSSFTFCFNVPDRHSEPASLRGVLLSSDDSHSLSDRVALASQLAQSVSYMHAFGFVHKNIRPENILMLKTLEAPIGRAYLVGFDNFRAAEGQTSRLGDSLWERNVYRHPRRQGDQPEEDYIMQHDIYSLGVCLLELGMWQSFVDYGSTEPGPCPSATLRLSPENPELHNADLLKNHLLTLARSVLPRRIGTKYSKVVETCLTCLDPENVDFGDEREFQDADGILVGVRYVEKVSSIFIAVNKKPLTIF
jgi:hypothetical protein